MYVSADYSLTLEQSILPFAVVGSEKTIVVNGREVRGRQNRWGVINGKTAPLPPSLPSLHVI